VRPRALVWLGVVLSGAAVLRAQDVPLEGRCDDEPDTLAAEAEELLARPTPALTEALDLYRRALTSMRSPRLLLRAADLSEALGDEPQAVTLLREAEPSGSACLSVEERAALARAAEGRGDADEALRRYRALRADLALEGESVAWLDEAITALEVEHRARSISGKVPVAPSTEARLAFAEARRALERGLTARARSRLQYCLRVSPGYVEAALALGALEEREGRTAQAIAAYRTAIAADPARFEAALALANLLWAEPDREAKRESLDWLGRAIQERKDLRALLRLSAERWAEWGDAREAFARLGEFRRGATADELKLTEALERELERRLAPAAETGEIPEAPGITSAAIEPWKRAQAYLDQGDEASVARALQLVEEAQRLDPSFGRAAELEATIDEKRGDRAAAEAALERAIRAEPARAVNYERLARLLESHPDGRSAAEQTWRRAEAAGSVEALFVLAESGRRAGRDAQASAFYRRYLEAAPGGVHAAEAQSALAEYSRRRRLSRVMIVTAILLSTVFGLSLIYRRRSGSTFEDWILSHPEAAREARPIVGRLRHETLKHGGLLIADAPEELCKGEGDRRREIAGLIRRRLAGTQGRPGILEEGEKALSALESLARRSGATPNFRVKDPLISPIARSLSLLSRATQGLRRLETEPVPPERVLRNTTERLRRAASAFQSAAGRELTRLLDRAAAIAVGFEDFKLLLGEVSRERGVSPPELCALGAFASRSARLLVRIGRGDWETIWRNLFANALEAGAGSRVKLAIQADAVRDPITGMPLVRFLLADNIERPLTNEMIRGRASDRGLGVVADLVLRNEGTIESSRPPDGALGFRKGVAVELPRLEVES
jgi:tetratricopeptide (TPR) repeat protein